MASEITTATLAQYLGIELPAPETPDGFVLDTVVRAVNAMVPGTVPRVRALAPGVAWPDDVMNAALMQGARLFTRRRSPTGVVSYTENGGPVYSPRWDPDIERLLQTGKWERPGFA